MSTDDRPAGIAELPDDLTLLADYHRRRANDLLHLVSRLEEALTEADELAPPAGVASVVNGVTRFTARAQAHATLALAAATGERAAQEAAR